MFIRGGLCGVVLGYMVSFLFQNEMIKQKLGFGGYLKHIIDVLFKSFDGMSEVAITAWVCMIVGAVAGGFIEKMLVSKRDQ